MAILDSKGRLFGKVNLLDAGAILIVLFVLAGIFLVPGPSGTLASSDANAEVDVLVLGLKTRNPQALIKPGENANFLIRNQPAGKVKIKNVEFLPRTTTAPQPDGSVKAVADPREEEKFSVNMIVTLEGKGQMTANGPVFGGTQIKVGTPVELDGELYNFKPSVIDIRVPDQ
ncbi:DUF4330 domain-containing protein [Acaryochloris sp. IP29b_bin.137]|uniref:DUF4330 domain-containing protein n=1 Tax=Acaryochloris sp. IP29b_bin.137 TaxID=2969217 RepID=UPI002610EFB3|nr:DUF4330 domain-containing protein [Acaryochloris sp. IP29b_bin.137]